MVKIRKRPQSGTLKSGGFSCISCSVYLDVHVCESGGSESVVGRLHVHVAPIFQPQEDRTAFTRNRRKFWWFSD